MKNKGFSLILLLVIAISFVIALAIGYFLASQKNFPGSNGGSGSKNVRNFEECAKAGYPVTESYPRQCRDEAGKIFVEAVDVQAPEIIPEVKSLLYEDKALSFQFWYPAGVEIKSKDFEGYLSLTRNLAVAIFLPDSLFSGTNLLEAVLIVGTDDDKKIIDNCGSELKEGQETGKGTASISGVDFSVFERRDAAAGSIYDEKIYRTVRNGKCYEVAELLHSGNIYNYEPGAVKEFNKEEISGILDKIADTFIFAQGGESGAVGSISLGPICPVERIPPESQCAPKPYQTEITIVRGDNPDFLKKIESDALGRFRVELEPGLYIFSAKGGEVLPRCKQLAVLVPDSGFAHLNISCDTGIR